MQVIVIFVKYVKKRKNWEIVLKVLLLVSREWLKESSLNLEGGLTWVESTSTVNLVPFGLGITELQMHENCEFVVPVNILTLFVRTLFSEAARHTTVCLDSYRVFITSWM